MSNHPKALPLQTKVSVTLAVLIGLFIVASWAILRQVIVPAFDDLEMSAARADLKRAEMALLTDLDNLQAITADWAPWDDIYFYVQGQNPGFERSNLDRPTLDNLGLDFLAIYGSGDRLMWNQLIFDDVVQDVAELGILSPGHPAAALLTTHALPTGDTTGLIATTRGPALISSQAILRSDDSGPVAGALVMGQFLDDEVLARLRERTGVDMHWDFGAAAEGHVASEGTLFDVGDTVISGTKTLTDIS